MKNEPMDQRGDAANGIVDQFLQHAPALGRPDITRKSFDLFSPNGSISGQNGGYRWFDPDQFRGRLAGVSPHPRGLNFSSPEVTGIISDLTRNAQVQKLGDQVLEQMNHRSPSKVIFMGESMGGIIAPLVMDYITKKLNNGLPYTKSRFYSLIVSSAPVIIQKAGMPETIIMNTPNNDNEFPKKVFDWCAENLGIEGYFGPFEKGINVDRTSDTNDHGDMSDVFKMKAALNVMGIIPKI